MKKRAKTYRESLVDRMIAIYGMEHNIVIHFAELCERWSDTPWNNECLRLMVEAHEATPIFEED